MLRRRIPSLGMKSARRLGGVIIVDSLEEEEEERTEKDKEVEKIFKKGQEAKRKILTGVSNEVKISTSICNIKYMYMSNMSNWWFLGGLSLQLNHLIP